LITGCREPILAQTEDLSVVDTLRRNAIIDQKDEWWGARHVPKTVCSTASLSASDHNAERISITGTIFMADGKTPSPNTLIYLYHTDEFGIYGRNGEHRHGRYRAWLLSDDDGSYSFETIRPASYPNSTQSAHIHMTVTTVDKREDWIDSILFEGDQFIRDRERKEAGNRGGFQPILKLEKRSDGKLHGRRDILLA
jgi:protocatechuate 3,4-dioxygenase beta subunit